MKKHILSILMRFGALFLATERTAVADPCDWLLGSCQADIDGDGTVNIQDVLALIGSFGEVGDGSYRTAGDIYPELIGDCIVDIHNLLALIKVFGSTCDAPQGS